MPPRVSPALPDSALPTCNGTGLLRYVGLRYIEGRAQLVEGRPRDTRALREVKGNRERPRPSLWHNIFEWRGLKPSGGGSSKEAAQWTASLNAGTVMLRIVREGQRVLACCAAVRLRPAELQSKRLMQALARREVSERACCRRS